jgi:hypothetical protein
MNGSGGSIAKNQHFLPIPYAISLFLQWLLCLTLVFLCRSFLGREVAGFSVLKMYGKSNPPSSQGLSEKGTDESESLEDKEVMALVLLLLCVLPFQKL